MKNERGNNSFHDLHGGSSQGMTNRLYSPSTISSKTYFGNGETMTSESLHQNDDLQSDSSVGIDIWKQSIKNQEKDPFKLYPLSNHPSPQQINFKKTQRYNQQYSPTINERSSLLPNRKSKNSSSSWWNRFVEDDNDNISICSSSSSSYSSNRGSQSSTLLSWKSLKRPLNKAGQSHQYPPDPYHFENGITHDSPNSTHSNKVTAYHYSPKQHAKSRISDLLSFSYNLHYFATAAYDIFKPHNIWLSRRGLMLNPWIGPSPITLSKFGALNPARIIYDQEYWRMLTSITLSSNLTQLVFNLLAIHLIIVRMEKRWGFQIILLIYLISSLTTALITTIFRPIYISTCSSAGILALLATNIIESTLSSIREKRFNRGRNPPCCTFIVSWKKKYGPVHVIILMNFIVGICPMVGFLPQLSGIICGILLGYVTFVGPLLEHPDSFPPKKINDDNSSFVPPKIFSEKGSNMNDRISHFHAETRSPDSPVTRKSLILSPDDEDDGIDTPSLISNNSNRSKCKSSVIPYLRALSVLLFALLFSAPVYAIGMGYVEPLPYMQNPSLTNCKYMRSIVLENFVCEQTCVPFAGVSHARSGSNMVVGLCEDVGYTCHVGDFVSMISKRKDASNGKRAGSSWTWNTEYDPIVSMFKLPNSVGSCSVSRYNDNHNHKSNTKSDYQVQDNNVDDDKTNGGSENVYQYENDVNENQNVGDYLDDDTDEVGDDSNENEDDTMNGNNEEARNDSDDKENNTNQDGGDEQGEEMNVDEEEEQVEKENDNMEEE